MPGTGKKMLMWLGLADAEEYDDYEPYEEVPVPSLRWPPRAEAARSWRPFPQTSPAVRTLPRDGQDARDADQPARRPRTPLRAVAVTPAPTGQGPCGRPRPSSPTPRR